MNNEIEEEYRKGDSERNTDPETLRSSLQEPTVPRTLLCSNLGSSHAPHFMDARSAPLNKGGRPRGEAPGAGFVQGSEPLYSGVPPENIKRQSRLRRQCLFQNDLQLLFIQSPSLLKMKNLIHLNQ